MAELEVDLQLTIRDALEAIDDMGNALSDMMESFQEDISKTFKSFEEDIELSIDTVSAERNIEQLLELVQPIELQVIADTEMASDTINDFTTEFENAPLDLTIEIDTNSLEEATTLIDEIRQVEPIDVSLNVESEDVAAATEDVDALTESMDNLAESSDFNLDDLTKAESGLSAASSIATGNVGALGGAFVELVPKAAPVVGAALGIGGAFALLYDQASKSQEATERLKIVFGDLAKTPLSINVGGLTGDLSELAIQAGVSGSALKLAAAATGEQAIGAGFAVDKAALLSTQLSALALRAVALNPALGEAGSVQERFNLMLGRGGPRLMKYNISLTRAEIKTEAWATKLESLGMVSEAAAVRTGTLNTLTKEQAEAATNVSKTLSDMDKTAAGAKVQLGKLAGTQLGDDFQKGIDQSAVKMKALKAEIMSNLSKVGAPLVEPMQKLFTAITPVAISFGKILGDVLKEAIPFITLLAEGFSQLTPILEPIGKVMLLAMAPIILLKKVFEKLFDIDIFKEFLNVIKDIGKAIKDFIKPLTDAIDAFDFEEALGKAKYYVKNLDKLWEQIVIRVKEIAPKLLEAGKDALIALGQGITSAAPAVLAFFLNLPSKIIELIGDIASWAFPIGLDIITALFNGIVSYAPKVFQFFLELPLKILGFLGNVVTLMFPKGVAFIEGILSGVVGKAVDLFNWFTSLPQKIVSAIGDLLGWTVDIGKQIVNGIIDGIRSAPGKVKDALMSVVKNAWNSVKNFLGIGSPSKLFADTVGLPISQGIAVGIGKGVPLTTKALSGLGSQLATTGSNFSVAAGSNLATMGSSRLEINQVNSGGGSPVIGSMTVIGQDPVSTAAAVGRELAFQRRFQGGT